MKSDIERLSQCLLCGNDPETCGASEEDENAEGLCLKFINFEKKFNCCDGDCKRCEAAEECSALWPTPDSKYLDPLKHTPWDPTEE